MILNNINFFKYHTLDSKYEFLTARFCGEIGDPLISPHLEDLIRIAETVFDKIDIFTNGGMRSPNWFKKISELDDRRKFIGKDEKTYYLEYEVPALREKYLRQKPKHHILL